MLQVGDRVPETRDLVEELGRALAAEPDRDEDPIRAVPARIAERLEAWRESGATTLLVATHDPVALRTMAELVL